jgi:hypothetical protein
LTHVDLFTSHCSVFFSNVLVERPAMNDAMSADVDLVKEFRLRRWARQHYVAAESRLPGWHPVVLDEMNCRDSELESLIPLSITAAAYVPLPPPDLRRIDHPHALPSTPNLIQADRQPQGEPQHSRPAQG